MTCPKIVLSLLIKENDMRIMLDNYLGLYCQFKNQLLITSLKRLNIIGTQEDKFHKDKSFVMLMISTIAW